MTELRVVTLVLIVLIGGGALLQVMPWHSAFGAGLALVALGMGGGLPASFIYHWKLRAALKPRGALDGGWLLRPVAHHARLQDDERGPVLRWFYLGAAGFGVALLGCALVAVGTLGADKL